MLLLPIDDAFSMILHILAGGPFIVALILLHPLLTRLGLFPRPSYPSGNVLTNKVVIVTGSNTGVGLQAALQLARLGATVVMACRSVEKAEAAAADCSPGSGSFCPMQLDLSDLKSVASFARAFKDKFGSSELHALICNAGVPAMLRSKTAQGFDLAFGVSFIGHFALVRTRNSSLDHQLRSPCSARQTGHRAATNAQALWWASHQCLVRDAPV